MVKGLSSGPMGAATLASGSTTAVKVRASSVMQMEEGTKANFCKTKPMERESILMLTGPGIKESGVMISIAGKVL